jgi:putative transposase
LSLIGSKKNLPCSATVRRELVEAENERISVTRQCELLGLNRTGIYYRGRTQSVEDANLMRLIDEQYTRTPFYGYRRMTVYLQNLGFVVNHKRVRRLMRKLGLEAIYPKPNLSKPGKDHLTYPYLLRGVAVEYSDQLWATDITYIRLGSGFVYLLVIMHWHSRFVIEMEVSNSLEASVFVETLKRAIKKGKPEIFNSDQGSQFTAVEWLKVLQENKIQISMDGRRRCFDNIFVERLWRTVKYEEVYLNEYTDAWETEESLQRYFEFYNYHRPHQSLNYQTPFEAYQKGHRTEQNKGAKAAILDNRITP